MRPDVERAIATAGPLLAVRIGLRVDGSTRGRLGRALREAAERAGRGVEEYAASLAGDEPELERVIERMTVQESSFFRHPEHFAALAEYVVHAHPPGVIWSAGCANGEEAWSVAMLLEELGAVAWTVLGTDVSARALKKASRGVYTERELRGLDGARRERFLRPAGQERMRIADRLHARVRFLRHNLVTEPPPGEAASYPGVLCRNVLIYLRRDDQRRFLTGLRLRMPADGVLLLGAAEALAPDDPSFEPQRIDGAYVYRPRLAAAVAAGARDDAPRAPRRRARTRPQRPRRPAMDPVVLPAASELVSAGERHAAAGEHEQAVTAFRKAVYLAPDDVLAHLRLALALERAGDPAGALRAFRAARFALDRSDPEQVEKELAGWSVAEVERLLEEKLETVA